VIEEGAPKSGEDCGMPLFGQYACAPQSKLVALRQDAKTRQ